LGAFLGCEQPARLLPLTAQLALWRAGERVLIADALLRLVGLSLDDVGHRVLGTGAVHDLLCRIVRVVDERPRYVAEVATLGQLFHRLARLELTGFIGDGVAIGGFEGHGTALLSRTSALPFYPRIVVRVHFVANAVW